ncbi:adenosylcobinamide-GDP ribazoletransferase [Pseudoruegeria sp. HB172150]|uniref:adenosylcobinamide-GDP ribazoletransferase n=1 Tax=Pseudoruegeria sp. HB172150 TaxID=2721164 RepID=UPI0015524362|nr:adenosylcobinamide-GDP ribazoletransferase [Pseudoruegeria sp. HB172150]
MAERDTSLVQAGDISVALALLTRLPVGRVPDRGARAAWAWPVAGLVVGLIAVVIGVLARWCGMPDALVSGLMLAMAVLVTGALHEDGLADVADGFWGGFDKARRLEIMKDSRIGSYGVIALVLSLGLRWAAMTALIAAGGFAWPVLAAAVLSRAPMAVAMWALPNARGYGLSESVGRPGRETVAIGLLVALGAGFLLVGPPVLLVALVLAPVTAGCVGLARAKLGGQTGDVLGAVQQVCEVAALAVLASLV